MIRDEQYHDALADFYGFVAEGVSTEAAIAQAATDNGLRPDVFEQRLAKAGPINKLVEQITSKLSREQRNAEIASAVAAFCKLQRSWIERSEAIRQRMFNYLDTNVDGELSTIDRAYADKMYKVIRDQEISQYLEDFRLKPGA